MVPFSHCWLSMLAVRVIAFQSLLLACVVCATHGRGARADSRVSRKAWQQNSNEVRKLLSVLGSMHFAYYPRTSLASTSRWQPLMGKVKMGVQIQTLPFSPHSLEGVFNLSDYVFLELKQNTRVYPLACSFIAVHANPRSIRYAGESEEAFFDHRGSKSGFLTTIGLGLFSFNWEEHKLYALHQALGMPVGVPAGVDFFTNLVLFAPSSNPSVLGQFCRELVAMSEMTKEGHVSLFEWNALNMFWSSSINVLGRPIDTIVLSNSTKAKLLTDITDFLAEDTRQWYRTHGIPYKRGYLFYGVPGAGKTSLVQAIAWEFGSSICSVDLAHPSLTDDSLRKAVNKAPRRSILVFEDVDAIFSKSREKLVEDSPLTFSGLLNAIDGTGKADGQIFVLTTNHRDRLSPALIRNGRVDMHIPFTYATDEIIAGMFRKFYPLSSDSAIAVFVQKLRDVLGTREVTPAALQHFFIQHRKSSYTRAISSVRDIVEEIELREDEQKMVENEKSSAAGKS